MLSGPSFPTPTELVTRAPLGSIPRSDIPGYEFRGKVGPVTHTGASTGVVTVDGFPIDVYPVVIQVVTPGDLGVATFAISLNAGIDFDDPILSDPNQLGNTRWDQELKYTGMVLHAQNGSGTPNSFLARDTWTLTSTASTKFLMVCAELSDYFRKWSDNVGRPLTDIDEADRTMLCQLGRYWLVSDRGEVPKIWADQAKAAIEHFRLESIGDIRLNAQPVGIEDALVFADFERARKPFTYRYWRH